MAGFLHSVTSFIAENPHAAYVVVGLLAFSESIPLIGAVVPGSAVIIAASALVPSGTLSFWPLLISAIIGAILGDGVSYWLGHHYHRELLGRWPLNRQPDLVSKSEAFFARHGDKSVFIARFTPGVRSVVPIFAGMLHMPARRFYAANILSALVWAPSHILPGVLAGASLGFLGAAAEPLAILIILLLAAVWIVYQLLRLLISRGFPLLERGAVHLRAWALRRSGWWARGLASLLDPAQPQARWLALLALLLAGAAWLFLGILEDVVNGDPLVQMDQSIYRALQDLRSPALDTVMITFTELGDTLVVVIVTAALFLWLAWNRAWRDAAYWLAAVAGASALNTVVKLTLHRARPGELDYTGASAFSFPSGHSTTNMALYGFLAFLVARGVRPASRPFVALAAICFVFMIALSRLYLGAHWFSDVVAGLAFGTLWISALAFSYLRTAGAPPAARGLAVAALAALAAAGGFNVWRHHGYDVARYGVQLPPGRSVTLAAWQAEGWKQLPAWRIDLAGETEEPLSLQWAGSLDALEARLQPAGWQRPPGWAPAQASGWLTAEADPLKLPALPRFAGGQLPSLTLIHAAGPGRRFVLRLWPSGLDVNGTVPVWLGSVVEERLEPALHLVTLAHTQDGIGAAQEALHQALAGGLLVPRTSATPEWDGRVLLGTASPPP